MRYSTRFGLLAAVLLIPALSRPATAQTAPPGLIDGTQLRGYIEGMGYEIKVLNAEVGKEKYEFTTKSGGIDVPIAAEISSSRNIIWLTVFLGKAPADSTSIRYSQMVKRNFKLQPTNFYMTDSGNLMLGLPVENRSVTASVLRRWIDKLSNDVFSAKDLWQ